MDRQTLENTRSKLEAELAAVIKELEDLGAHADGTLEVSLDEGFADAAHTTSERSTVLSLIETLQGRADDITKALSRVEDGSYGKCVRCGNEIQADRLEAIPASKYCINCAKEVS